ncbi:MAG: hypothetical protein ACKOAS_10620 [Verrucomicrobiota bacterium]
MKRSPNYEPDPPEPRNGSASDLPDYEIDGHERRSILQILASLFQDLRFRLVAAILVLGLAGWFFGPPAYRKAKSWRANQLMDQCQAAADAGNFPQAASLMRQAILMAPSNPLILQRVRLFSAAMGDPAALGILQTLMQDNKANPEEILVVAEQSLRARRPDVTRAALEKLATHPSARRTIVEMRLLALDGKPQEGVELSRAAMKDLPPADSEKILLATAELVLQTNPDVAREILQPLAEKPDATGLSARRLLVTQALSLPKTITPGSETLATPLETHPLHTPDDILLAAELRLLANPSARPALLAQLAQDRSAATDEDALAFARWLNRRKAHRETIEFIGPDRATTNADWLLVYLDAHAGLDRWDDIFKLLQNAKVSGLSESIRMLFLARAAKESGDTAKSEEIWTENQRALLFEKPEVISFVAAYALRTGETAQARAAFTTLSRRKETALQGHLGIIRTTPKNSPAIELIPVYQSLLETHPDLAEARNDLTYLELLTQQNTFDATLRALEAHKKTPASLATISIAALAHLRNNEPAKAEALYEGKFIPWSTAPDPWKNIRAAVLLANGKTTEANELLSTLDRSQLRPEERALLPAEQATSTPEN